MKENTCGSVGQAQPLYVQRVFNVIAERSFGDDEDHGVRTSKKPKTATVDEEEEETMNVDAQDDNKDDEKDDNKDNKKADKKDDKKMVTFTLRQGSRQLTVVAPR